MMAVEYLFVDLGVGNLLEMKKGEIVFEVHFAKVKILEACVVVGMHLGRIEVTFVVVVVECWESFVALHLLLFEALLFGMRRNVGWSFRLLQDYVDAIVLRLHS